MAVAITSWASFGVPCNTHWVGPPPPEPMPLSSLLRSKRKLVSERQSNERRCACEEDVLEEGEVNADQCLVPPSGDGELLYWDMTDTASDV